MHKQAGDLSLLSMPWSTKASWRAHQSSTACSVTFWRNQFAATVQLFSGTEFAWEENFGWSSGESFFWMRSSIGYACRVIYRLLLVRLLQCLVLLVLSNTNQPCCGSGWSSTSSSSLLFTPTSVQLLTSSHLDYNSDGCVSKEINHRH